MQEESKQVVFCNDCKYHELWEDANLEMNYRCMHPQYKGTLWTDNDIEVDCDFFTEESC